MNLRALLALAILMVNTGCYQFRQAVTPMPTVALADPRDAEALVVLLPGIQDRPQKFESENFADPLAGRPVRVIAADSHFGYFRNRTVVDRLRADVVDPNVGQAEDVILVGVSLGGLGALKYWCDTRDPRIRTIVLLAPYLGEPEIIDEIRSAGPDHWTPGVVGAEHERGLWQCLITRPWEGPRLILGYGGQDDLAPAHQLLAGLLAERDVHLDPDGGHDWETWTPLWRAIVPKLPLD